MVDFGRVMMALPAETLKQVLGYTASVEGRHRRRYIAGFSGVEQSKEEGDWLVGMAADGRRE
jgi:hypothetical protein